MLHTLPGFGSTASATAYSHPTDAGGQERSQTDFLSTLFRKLDENGVRYCVLHSWDGLPHRRLSSDLDVAVHPQDVERVPSVLRALNDRGYCPVQCVNYSVNAYAFTFSWVQGNEISFAILDVCSEHRAGGLIAPAGEALVRGRRKQGIFWVASPAAEFGYLLAKKADKGSVSTHQAKRLRELIKRLGRTEAEAIADELFGRRCGRNAVEACVSGSINKLLGRLRRQTWVTSLTRHPFELVQYLFEEGVRLARRWLYPTGMFMVILGPDGSGKTTVAEHLMEVLKPVFRRKHLAHWRPGFLGWGPSVGVVTNPHGLRPRGRVASAAHVLAFFLDDLLGFCLMIYPLLARTALVVFDRYFQDVLVDPKRYRYGGPAWLPRLLARFVPPRDQLLLVLDAPEGVILSRKNEVTPQEVCRQRQDYRRLAVENPGRGKLLMTDKGLQPTLAQASEIAVAYLAAKFKRQHGSWLAPRVPESVRTPSKWRKWRREDMVVTRCPTLAQNEDDVLQAIEAFIGPATQRSILRPESVLPLDGDTVLISFSPSGRLQRELVRAGYTHRCEFSVLPNCEEPRWLLPIADTPTMLSGLQMYTPFAVRARLLKALLEGMILLGWRGWKHARVLLARSSPLPLQVMVTDITGEERPAFALSLGKRERFRALTAQVTRPSGEVLGYIKLPLTEAATERLRHEANMLTGLWDKSPRLRPHIPRVLYSGEWSGTFILFQSSGPRTRGPNEFGTIHIQFLEQLWQAQTVDKGGHALVGEVAARWQQVEPQLGTEWHHLGQAALREAERQLEGTTVSCGVMHGDFAPWNTRQENGSLFAFDWESARWAAPKLWDVFHFNDQVTILLHEKPMCYAEFGLTSPADDALLLLYRLHRVCEALEHGGSYLAPKINHQKRQIFRCLQERSSAHQC